jgi:hypothetical protein
MIKYRVKNKESIRDVFVRNALAKSYNNKKGETVAFGISLPMTSIFSLSLSLWIMRMCIEYA